MFSVPSTSAAPSLPVDPQLRAPASPSPTPISVCSPWHLPYVARIDFVTELNPPFRIVPENKYTTVGFNITSPAKLNEAVVHIEIFRNGDRVRCYREVRPFTAGQLVNVSFQYLVPSHESTWAISGDRPVNYSARVVILSPDSALTYYYSGIPPAFQVLPPN